MKNNQKNLFGRTRGLSSNAAKSTSPNAVTNKRSFTTGQTGTTQQYASPNAITNKRTFTTGRSGSTAQTGQSKDDYGIKAVSPNAVTNKRTFSAAGQGTSNQKQQSFDELYSPIQNQPALPDLAGNTRLHAAVPNAVTNKRSFTAVRTVGTIAPKPQPPEPTYYWNSAGHGADAIGAQNAALQGNSTPAATKTETPWRAPGGLGSRTLPFTTDEGNNNSHASFAAQTRQKLAGDDQWEMFRPEEGVARYRKRVDVGNEIKYSEPVCLVANREGPIHDRLQPTVKALEGILRDVDKELTNLTSQILHDPDLKKHQEKMEFLQEVKKGVEGNIADMPYLLTEEMFENPYMANFADLLCLRVVGKEAEQRIRKALEYLYTAMDTHYSKGEYTMLAAAIDCAAVLERKLPEYAFALGAANEKALHLPQLAEAGLFRLYKGDETKQILLHMMSTEAVKVANPRAYDNGKNAIFLYDAITKSRGLVKSGAFDLSAFSKMNKKQLAGVASKFGSTAIQVFGEKTLEGFVMRLAEHLYETGMSE